MSKAQREKGKRGERMARDWWRENGYPCERTAQTRGGPESPDVRPHAGWNPTDGFNPPLDREHMPRPLPVHVEVKIGKNCPNPYAAMEQALRDRDPGNMPIVMLKKDYHEWLFVLRGEDAARLFREMDWDDQKEGG